MSGAVTGLVVDGPDRLRGRLQTARVRDVRYYEQGDTSTGQPGDAVEVGPPRILTLEELRVGNRVFRVWLELSGPPTQSDVTRGILALIDADPADVHLVEVL